MSETIVKSLFTILAAVISGVCLLRTTQMEYVQKNNVHIGSLMSIFMPAERL